ncbi:hypothetical protein Scep_028866 [Stephania cephalantha]|uniref:Uncharacterized protein n=1 Tax=Stephania cephalantha TaxID=152367 RepID=A0AAP0EJ53_9MAGN
MQHCLKWSDGDRADGGVADEADRELVNPDEISARTVAWRGHDGLGFKQRERVTVRERVEHREGDGRAERD